MMTTLRINVPKLLVVCLDCNREAEVPPRGIGVPVDVVVPCECNEAKPVGHFALQLRYSSEREPVALLVLQEGRPGMRAWSRASSSGSRAAGQ